jgi:hypothetical protein
MLIESGRADKDIEAKLNWMFGALATLANGIDSLQEELRELKRRQISGE